MNNIKDRVLKQIEEGKIERIPRWQFIVKNDLLWLVLVLLLLSSGLAYAVLHYLIEANDWQLYQSIDNNLVLFALRTFPYVWAVVMGATMVLLIYVFRKTKKGYKYSLYIPVGVAAVIIVAAGVGMTQAHIGERIDTTLSERAPFYNKLLEHRQAPWISPEKGVLAGVVTEVTENGFTLRDIRRNEWEVRTPEIEDIQMGARVKVLGEQVDDSHFSATQVDEFNFRKLRNKIRGGKRLPFERNIPRLRITQ